MDFMHELTAPMEPAEIKAARRAFGWTQHQMAEALGLTGKNKKDTVRAWELGKNPITGPARVAIRLLLAVRADRSTEGGFDRALALYAERGAAFARSTGEAAPLH